MRPSSETSVHRRHEEIDLSGPTPASCSEAGIPKWSVLSIRAYGASQRSICHDAHCALAFSPRTSYLLPALADPGDTGACARSNRAQKSPSSLSKKPNRECPASRVYVNENEIPFGGRLTAQSFQVRCRGFGCSPYTDCVARGSRHQSCTPAPEQWDSTDMSVMLP